MPLDYDTSGIEGTKNIPHALSYVCVVHGDDEDIIDALCLERVVLLDVSGHLQAARGCKSPRHTQLNE